VAVRTAFERASRASSKSSRRKSVRASARRRSREELAALEERLYEAIRRHPGETMTVIASVVGATARELNRPAMVLRREGRVRSVGRRQYTRYFPMGE
jgi:predicted Zn-dependent protease